MLWQRAKQRKIRGFTLIELLTVMFILAVLASIMIPNMRRAFYRAKYTGCVSNLRNLATAMNQYIVEKKVYPDQLTELTPNYIQVIPTCPSAQASSYIQGYEKASEPERFTLRCGGTHHSDMGLRENEPWYNFETGLGPR